MSFSNSDSLRGQGNALSGTKSLSWADLKVNVCIKMLHPHLFTQDVFEKSHFDTTLRS